MLNCKFTISSDDVILTKVGCMKNNILFVFILYLAFCVHVNAAVLKAKAVDEISTTEPKEFISVKISRDFVLDNEITLKKNYILTGKMLDISEPGKWHHNASFTFIPTSYTDLDGNSHTITKEIKATYRQKMKPDLKHSEITVGPWMFSPAYIDDTKKIIHGETKEVFEGYCDRTTPWGKGTQIDIKPKETIYFNFE